MEGTPADIGYVKYDMEFKTKMKENALLLAGLNIKFNGFNLNLGIKSKGISAILANLNIAF